MEDIIDDIVMDNKEQSIIMVAGVGGAGGNAVNHMWNLGIKGTNFAIFNTDKKALDNMSVENKVCISPDGLGAGNNPEVGRQYAIDALDTIRFTIESAGTRMLFITAGMGGGTGTGAAPVIAKLAHEMGLLTVAIVTSPLILEGPTRYDQAKEGIKQLRQYVDSLLVIDTENIGAMFGDLPIRQAFSKADDILASAVKGIAEIITVEKADVRVDFADVSRVMRDSGAAHMGVAYVKGEDRARRAVEEVINSPLLDRNQISGAQNILLSFSVESIDKLVYKEVTDVLGYVQAHASVRDENGVVHAANIIWGSCECPGLGDTLELVLIATGFDISEDIATPKPMIMPIPAVVDTAVTDSEKPHPLAAKKPLQKPLRPATALPAELSPRSTRYDNIEKLLNTPAYVRRNMPLATVVVGGRTETLKGNDEQADKKAPAKELF